MAPLAAAPMLSPSAAVAASAMSGPMRPSSGLIKTKDGVELFYKDW